MRECLARKWRRGATKTLDAFSRRREAQME
jgi:hypothetical protein